MILKGSCNVSAFLITAITKAKYKTKTFLVKIKHINT